MTFGLLAIIVIVNALATIAAHFYHSDKCGWT